MSRLPVSLSLTTLAALFASHAVFAVPTGPDYVDDSQFLTAAKTRVLPPDIPWQGKSLAFAVKPDDAWATPLEASNFTRTPRYTETVTYLERLARAKPGLIELVNLPEKTDEGRPFVMAVVSTSADKSPAGRRPASRPCPLRPASTRARPTARTLG